MEDATSSSDRATTSSASLHARPFDSVLLYFVLGVANCAVLLFGWPDLSIERAALLQGAIGGAMAFLVWLLGRRAWQPWAIEWRFRAVRAGLIMSLLPALGGLWHGWWATLFGFAVITLWGVAFLCCLARSSETPPVRRQPQDPVPQVRRHDATMFPSPIDGADRAPLVHPSGKDFEGG